MFAQWSGMRERSVYSGKLLIAQIRLSLWGGGGGGLKGYFVFLQEKPSEVTKTHFEYNETYISSLIEKFVRRAQENLATSWRNSEQREAKMQA